MVYSLVHHPFSTIMMMTDEQIDFLAEVAKQERLKNARNWNEIEWIKQDVDYCKICMKAFKRYCEETNRRIQYQQRAFANWLAQKWR